MGRYHKMVAGISILIASFVSVSILLALTVLPPQPKRATPPLSFPQLGVREGFCFGKVFVIEVDNANRLDVWVGEQMRGKQRMGNHALAIVREASASAVVTASSHWWTGKGFIALGQVIQDGESIGFTQRRCAAMVSLLFRINLGRKVSHRRN
ncbi:MAG: hypothetical protein ACUVRR_03780 [Candidatus Fervidibacter sp.]|uniref:hypothetical protein n=1 Tax=Candidatus Fervidibacter sp. TaxID=3100871 RepID=UPI00404AB9BC